ILPSEKFPHAFRSSVIPHHRRARIWLFVRTLLALLFFIFRVFALRFQHNGDFTHLTAVS
ncbi:MAG: hypothetical protein ACI4TW_07730, partial [Prevotella sp.]